MYSLSDFKSLGLLEICFMAQNMVYSDDCYMSIRTCWLTVLLTSSFPVIFSLLVYVDISNYNSGFFYFLVCFKYTLKIVVFFMN